ncbi:acetyl-CoA acetyltransferase [Nocardiopsis mwathae]|uniref:Acetyl-CoA acetyltransferase n=1 Tax=Nocardiopsis mwathae TaxID=1472723 RepID=A0A7W9YDL3_9ACTN|nr:lipid-transfer protein [Nocardiopsis mwathae]MBB6170215.1 acetyl-CoA acetyltransferase [Nocardiopsis mwathae]
MSTPGTPPPTAVPPFPRDRREGDVAVVAFSQTRHMAADSGAPEARLVHTVVSDVLQRAGIDRGDIGFTVSGSLDYLAGTPFTFVGALDAVGAWPPISESHVEMDAAWALYEAWLRLRHGDIDTALVYGFGKATQGDLPDILTLQLDPYYLAPLGIDDISLAALQARALLDAERVTEADLAAVVDRSYAAARANPYSAQAGFTPDTLLTSEYVAHPLRPGDIARPCDGAAAVLLATGDTARRIAEAQGTRPAWIRGLEQRVDAHGPGARDLTRCDAAERAAVAAGVGAAPVQVAEVHARYSHQEPLLRGALGLDDGVEVNPSGGPLGADPVMATGLVRVGEVARRIAAGAAERGVAHAAQGPCLQHNLVTVLEG